MTVGQLKVLLDSFVAPEEREFAVCFTTRRTRRVLGAYRRTARIIKIVRKNNLSPRDVVATGLHELAHHLTWEKDQHQYYTRVNGKSRSRHHGKSFFLNLCQLTEAFNDRYRKRLKGAMFCDARRPAQSPFYLTPEEWLFEIIVDKRRFAENVDVLFPEPEGEGRGVVPSQGSTTTTTSCDMDSLHWQN